jgi:hypothetical protein
MKVLYVMIARESISFCGRTHDLHGSKNQDKSADRESDVLGIFQTGGEPTMRDNIPIFKGILLVCGRTTLRPAQS